VATKCDHAEEQVARKSKQKPDANMPQVTLTFPAGLLRRLDDHAATERRSRSNAAALLIERALDSATSKAAS